MHEVLKQGELHIQAITIIGTVCRHALVRAVYMSTCAAGTTQGLPHTQVHCAIDEDLPTLCIPVKVPFASIQNASDGAVNACGDQDMGKMLKGHRVEHWH
jgi:hypothetical protein